MTSAGSPALLVHLIGSVDSHPLWGGQRCQMPTDKEDRIDVQDAPEESRGEAEAAKAAVDSQVKPPDLVQKEQQQAELRERRKTPSSTSLPMVQLFEEAGDRLAKIADRVVRLGDAFHVTSDDPKEDPRVEAKNPPVEEPPLPILKIEQIDEGKISEASNTIYK